MSLFFYYPVEIRSRGARLAGVRHEKGWTA